MPMDCVDSYEVIGFMDSGETVVFSEHLEVFSEHLVVFSEHL